MLLKCKECGGIVSSVAKTCPHCGFKPYRWNFVRVSIAVLMIAFAISMFSTCYQTSQDPHTPSKPYTGGPASARMVCEDALRVLLKSPSTAKFSGNSSTRTQEVASGVWTVHGYVDSQNSFGAVLRTNYFCKAKYGDPDWEILDLNAG